MSLATDLRNLGVCDGDTLMIHASLRKVGAPATAVISALEEAVGPTGTLLMLLSAEEDETPFDPLQTPAFIEGSYLAEALRQTGGTLVTNHPDGRFGARGARAQELLRDPPWDDYYGRGSPLEHLCEVSGRVLRLGADDATTTLIHYAEHLVELPNAKRIRRDRLILEGGQPVIRTIDCLDNTGGIVDWPGEDYFAVILRDYLASGAGHQGLVGGARSELLEAADLVAFAVRWMSERFSKLR